MVDSARARRLAAVWLVVLALVAPSACSWPGAGEPAAPNVVSYSGAAERLAALDPLEAQEQVRDWARLGLASSLGLNRKQIVDALYDTTPIRDPLFAELVEQPTGSGRALFDGTTLHILVPHDDPHPSRTIGQLLDQHRADAGTDPVQVQLHRYQIRPDRQRVELSAEPPSPISQIRAAHGWQEKRVDQQQGLAEFLATTSQLSRLETRGTEIWAAGWQWPGTSGAQVTVEDVSALQRSYRQDGGTPPGFSLDPQRPPTPADVRATIPGLDPGLAERITSGNWAGSGYASAAELAGLVGGTLFENNPLAGTLPARGLPADRTQLWALHNLLAGEPVYSQARYEGGLAGTEAGMSLFYVDLVAKDWTSGAGTGVPAEAVPGFVPDSKAATPASLCPRGPIGESGRLWFGQNDTAFTSDRSAIAIGARATRLFSRSNGPNGTEVEPSFRFGRGLRWWDQHYQAIADYEPQYQRLEQLMRWSGALEWLASSGPADGRGAPPRLPESAIRTDLRFADWYAAHGQLRERAPLTLVTPPSAQGREALLTTPSATTPNCGLLQIRGGVSLGGVINRHGRGQITDRRTQEVRRGPDTASVETTGSPRSSIPFGDSRPTDASGSRQLVTEFRFAERDFTFDAKYQGVPLDGVTARVPPSSGVQLSGGVIDINLRPGPLESLRAVIPWISKDGIRGLDAAPGHRYSYRGRQTISRFDNVWIEVGNGPTSSRTDFAVQVATPHDGLVEVRAVTPRQLSDADIASLEVTQGPTVTTFSDMGSKIPGSAPVYVSSLVGAEAAATVPAAIPANARVSFRVARPTRDARSPGPISREGRTWSLVDRPVGAGPGIGGNGPGGGGDDPGGGGNGPGGGGGGSGGGESGGGGFGPGRVVLGQEIVLVTVCPPPSQQSPQHQPAEESCQ